MSTSDFSTFCNKSKLDGMNNVKELILEDVGDTFAAKKFVDDDDDDVIGDKISVGE